MLHSVNARENHQLKLFALDLKEACNLNHENEEKI